MTPQNKVAVITGATGGLGSAYARQLSADGYELILVARNPFKLDQLNSELKLGSEVKVTTLNADLASLEQTKRIADILARLERIDMLVNCAGYREHTRFSDETVDDAIRMLNVHVTSTIALVHAVLPGMIARKEGHIIAVSSMAAFIPSPGSCIYTATKSFLNSFMECLHMEVHEHNIRVQGLCPGFTHTNFHPPEENDREIAGINLWMNPDEVVKYSLDRLNENEVICIPGFVNRTIRRTIPVLPRKLYYRIAETIRENGA